MKMLMGLIVTSKSKQKSLEEIKQKIKSELDTVYIDSNGNKYIEYVDALCGQSQINICIKSKLKQKEKTMEIADKVLQVLKSENWGVYYKNQPIQPLEMQDGNALYKVNQVDDDEIEEEIINALTEEKPWESSQTDSSQNNNSTNG